MFQIKDKVDDIVDDVEEIAKTYYKLSVVNVADKGSKLGASLMITICVFALFLFALFFVCMGLSWWIGQKLGSPVAGFFVVAGILFIIILILFLLKNKITTTIRNIVINKIYG